GSRERDRADRSRRRRAGARGERRARAAGLPRNRDPPADGTARHRASALRVLGGTPDGGRARRGRRRRASAAALEPARPMSALFVTATGTDVGKTYVTCLMIRALRERGRAVRALKPIA